MILRLATWNVEGRLSDSAGDAPRSTPARIADEILRLDADVVYVPEARGAGEIAPECWAKFAAGGYEMVECLYDDTAREVEDALASRASVFLSRVKVAKCEFVKYDAYRQLPILEVEVGVQRVTIAGIHLDDRSENQRVVQAKAVIERLKTTMSLVLMGDFNATHRTRDTALYRVRAVRSLAKVIPHDLLNSVVRRFLEMSDGRALRLLEDGLNVRDADHRHRRPTITPKMRGMEWMPSVPIAQIDHVFLSAELAAVSAAVQKDAGSDHRAVVVEVSFN